MKLHDLRPAPGSRTPKRRVGRGIAAGGGKTAGRGTKGQKSRAGGSLPAWFEGGQTPLHQRIPKLRGFRNPFKLEYEIVNLGAIAQLVELGRLESGELPEAGEAPPSTEAARPAARKRPSKAAAAPITVNQEILRAAGLVRTVDKPLKVLGHGELSTALFVVADAFSVSARTKIEAAGGSVSVLEVPGRPMPALGVATPGVQPPEAPVPLAATLADATPVPVEPAAAPVDVTAAPVDAVPDRSKRGAAKPASRKRASAAASREADAGREPARAPESHTTAPSDEPDAAAESAGDDE